LPSSFWLPGSPQTVSSLQTLATWVISGRRAFTAAAQSEFLSSADYLLVATAHAGGHTVVTREQLAPDAKKRVKIPDACVAMNVSFIDPFLFYQSNGLHLVQSD